MKPRSKMYFRWMGAYWSCTPEVWFELQKLVEERRPLPDFEMVGIRQIKYTPKVYEQFTDNPDLRRTE